MPFQTHDPYLNTVKRELKDRYYRERKLHMHDKKPQNQQSNSFLSQKINLTDFINLPEGTLNLLLFIAFVVIPYIAGIAFIFFLIANANFDTFDDININDYFIYWTIGYEVLASLLMILVIISAIKFRQSKEHKK